MERLIQGRRYAFIRFEDGRRAIMHWSALERIRFTELRLGQQLECLVEAGAIGLQPLRVRPLRYARGEPGGRGLAPLAHE